MHMLRSMLLIRPALPVLSYLGLVRMPRLNLALEPGCIEPGSKQIHMCGVLRALYGLMLSCLKLQDGLDTSAA